MTKNELMKLLGIEALMRRNAKSKEFETMLDIICDFLMISRAVNGGVQLPNEQSNTNSTNDTSNISTTQSSMISKQQINPAVAQRKAGSQVRKPVPQVAPVSKTQANWFNPPQEQEQKISQKPKPQQQQQDVIDDWDLEEDSKANLDGYIPKPKLTSQVQHQDPWANLNSQNKQQQQQINQLQQQNNPALNKRKSQPVHNQHQNNQKQQDIDDLDDLMGFGGSGGQDNNKFALKQKGEEQMRDTLGFLKKSEQEKKMREEQKRQNIMDQNSKYKSLQELKYNLNGYSESEEGIYDYNLAQISAATRQSIKQFINEQNISVSESNQIRKLLFKSANSNFHDSWHQGFYFDSKINYGIYQREGGPCGILASVEAFFLKHLLYVSQTQLNKISKEKRENYIAAAIVDILINASDEQSNKICLVIPSQNPKNPILPNQCSRLLINTYDKKVLYNIVKENISYYINPDGHGVILLVYSVILTKGINNIINDMDIQDNSLLTEHGYASQELINIILVGKAVSNVFNGDKDMGDNFILKGIHKQSDIGFLTLFEAYGYFQVGTFLKNPRVPIWIICSESHYSVIFSLDYSLISSKRQSVFDLVYYDELARQEDDYIMTIQVGMYKGPVNLQETSEMIPPIDAVIRTKWDRGLVDWNGRQAIL